MSVSKALDEQETDLHLFLEKGEFFSVGQGFRRFGLSFRSVGGTFLFEEGTFLFAFGTFLFEEGTFLFAFGTFLFEKGTFLFAFGRFLFEGGTFLFAFGTFLFEGGTFLFAFGTFLFEKGMFLQGCGRFQNGSGGFQKGAGGSVPAGGKGDFLHRVHEEIGGRKFAWQEACNSIAWQEEHHRKRTFREESVEFLKRSGVKYDERLLWRAPFRRPHRGGCCV